jgi:hypothetical protein
LILPISIFTFDKQKQRDMNEYDIKRLGLILSIQAEVEGMKTENYVRESTNLSPAYTDEDFCVKAEELRVIVSKHNDQL